MSTFRDAIAAMYDGPEGPFAKNTADAVLAMPEMEAIRKALACFWTHEPDCYCGADTLGSQQTIVQWVESAPSAHGGDQ